MAGTRGDRIQALIAFLTILLITNVMMAFYWQATMSETVYHCWDSLGFLDYFTPGSWAHGDWVHVKEVEKEWAGDTLLVG